MPYRSDLVVIGAGPKAAALAAKTHVLNNLGFGPISLTIVEAHEPAASWLGGKGFTSGWEPLSTSPVKDIGFPYKSWRSFGSVGRSIDEHLLQFSWTQFLISEGLYQTWVDAGMPMVTHKEYGEYVKWVLAASQHGVFRVEGRVSSVSLHDAGSHWLIDVVLLNETLQYCSEALVVTGPGKLRSLPHDAAAASRLLHCDGRRSELEKLPRHSGCDIAIVGGGESALASTLFIRSTRPTATVTVYAPSLPMSRTESFLENRVYSDPDGHSWSTIDVDSRRDFIMRSDRGVFSADLLSSLGFDRQCSFVIGRVLYVGDGSEGSTVCLEVQTPTGVVNRSHEYVINCTGFDVASQLRGLLTAADQEKIARQAGALWSMSPEREVAIGRHLEIEGLVPLLHVPALAGLSQGPGFANLSCLGLFADRVLERHCAKQSVNGAITDLVARC